MEQKRVKVLIDTEGNAKIDMIGFNGVGCGELAAKLAVLGRSVSETNKPEFYESSNNGNAIVQG